MTPRENYLRAARRRNPEWIPLDFAVSREARKMFQRHLGADVDYIQHFKFDCRWFAPSAGTRRPTPDWRARYYADGSLPADAAIDPEWGVAHVHYPASDDAQSYHPLRAITSAAEFDAYPWPPDVGAPERCAGVAEQVRATQAAGLATIGAGLDFFEHPWALTGFERMLEAMAADEPWARRLFARHAEDLVRTAETVASLGVDVIQTGSDVATQRGPLLSPTMWRDWLFPLMREAFAAAKRVKPDILVEYHSDGNVEPLIEGFIEAGVDILNPIQPECLDIVHLKERYGDQLTFHGGIGVQTVMPFGTPQDVRNAVRRTIDCLGANGGGYICCTAHMVRPEVPWANVLALVDTVREYGHP